MRADDAYLAKVNELLAQAQSLTERQVQQLLATLADVRKSLIEELADLAMAGNVGTFDTYQLRALRDAVDRAGVELATRYKKQLGSAQAAAWQAGANFAPETLGAAGLKFAWQPEIDPKALLMAQ